MQERTEYRKLDEAEVLYPGTKGGKSGGKRAQSGPSKDQKSSKQQTQEKYDYMKRSK